jgi:aryl-alcohol dehydrogenase-like predicted oxidoreductase
MQTRAFGRHGVVGALSLGGGGIGQVWGPTSHEEAVATVRAGVEAGITYIDVAPHYGRGEAERVTGDAFDGRVPEGVRVSTKTAVFTSWVDNKPVRVGHDRTPEQVREFIERSLAESLARLRLPRVDLFFLHDRIIPDDAEESIVGVTRDLFVRTVRPMFDQLEEQGRIGGWAISAFEVPVADIQTLCEQPAPHAAQLRVSALYPPTTLGPQDRAPDWGDVVATAVQHQIPVIGVQPTHGGALTSNLDRPLPENNEYMRSYRRVAPFRALAAELGLTPATLAHRYALTVPDVATVLLGVKNRAELRECIAAEAAGPLDAETVEQVNAAVAVEREPQRV